MGIFMMLCTVLLSGCEIDHSGNVTKASGQPSNEQDTKQPDQEDASKLIAASPNKEVKLYKIEELKAGLKRVSLHINGKQKKLEWNMPNTGTKPQVFYTDLTGDGEKEAIIIIQTGRGTGLDIYDIHVIQAEDLSEIKVQRYDDIVAKQIKSKVTKNGDGTLAISVKTQGKEYHFDYDFDPAPKHKQDELYFGGVVIYGVENQTINLYLGASVGISPSYVCDFNITYKFDRAKKEYIVDQIKVEPVEK